MRAKQSKLLNLLLIVGALSCSGTYAFADNVVASSVTDAKEAVTASIDDQTLEHNVNNVLSAQIPHGSFTIASYNNDVLLAGQVPTSADKTKAEAAVAATAGVKKVWNYLTVGPNEDSVAISKDAYLTSAAKTRLVAQKGVNTNNIKVVTSNKVVYVLGDNPGKRTQVHAGIAGIRQISGVNKVVNLTSK